jgi:hypothetical protein
VLRTDAWGHQILELLGRAEADLEEIGDYTLEHWGDAKLVEDVTSFPHPTPLGPSGDLRHTGPRRGPE